MNRKWSVLLLIALLITITIVSLVFVYSTPQKKKVEESNNSQNQSPQIVATSPDPLDNGVITTEQTIEITFNKPLQNVGEFKLRIEPDYKHKVELSDDKKTAKIIPTEPLDFGVGYTIFIGHDTKFEGVGEWGQDKEFHFRTINYRGV